MVAIARGQQRGAANMETLKEAMGNRLSFSIEVRDNV